MSYKHREPVDISEMSYSHVDPPLVEEAIGEHDPVPVSEMDRSRYHGHHTICQTLRDMYHETEDENIRLKLRLCMAFTKAMNSKLQWYKHRDEEEARRKEDAIGQ